MTFCINIQKKASPPSPLSCREGEHEQRKCAKNSCYSLNACVLRVICSVYNICFIREIRC